MEMFHEPLTAIHPGNLTDQLINRYGRMAKSFAITGWFGLQGNIEQRTAQAFAKLITGAEIGLGPMASMRCIHALSTGKIELHAILIAALIRRSPKYDYKVVSRTTDECTVEFLNIEGSAPKSLGTSNWTLERAKTAGLKGGNWQKNPMSMLFARCMTDGERTYCPDVVMVGPLYGIGEIDTQETEAPDVMQVAQEIAQGEVLSIEQHDQEVKAAVDKIGSIDSVEPIPYSTGDGGTTATPHLSKVDLNTPATLEDAVEKLEKMKEWVHERIGKGQDVQKVVTHARGRVHNLGHETAIKEAHAFLDEVEQNNTVIK